jgi:quinol monooxygenase YgiN
MLIVHVHVQVKPECVTSFLRATLENAQHSIQEAGIVRFDVIQQTDDPSRFVLIEIYRTDQIRYCTKRRLTITRGVMRWPT